MKPETFIELLVCATEEAFREHDWTPVVRAAASFIRTDREEAA